MSPMTDRRWSIALLTWKRWSSPAGPSIRRPTAS